MTTGLNGQVGFKSESTWGTAVVVDKFVPFSKESMKQKIEQIVSKAIRAGRRTQATHAQGRKTVGGGLELDLPNNTLAVLLKHMFGTVATSGAGPYTHTATPGDLTGDSLTVQVGKPGQAGTVHPFTYAGCKINEWTLKCSVGEYATLELDITAKSETTATALASASYTAGYAPFTFVQGSVTFNGVSIAVTEATLSGKNGLRTDHHHLGSADITQQKENNRREYSGALMADFEDLTQYNRFVAGTEHALVLTFSNGTESLTITCNVYLEGETPEVAGEEQLDQPLPFVCSHATADASAITAVLVNSESSAA